MSYWTVQKPDSIFQNDWTTTVGEDKGINVRCKVDVIRCKLKGFPVDLLKTQEYYKGNRLVKVDRTSGLMNETL